MNKKKFKQKINEILGQNNLIIVDVGAALGFDPIWKEFTSALKVVLFEPEPTEYEKLSQNFEDNQIVLNTVLGEKTGEINFNITSKLGVSSVYNPNFSIVS